MVLSAYRHERRIVQLHFVRICYLDFPLLSWAGLWSQFITSAFHSRDVDLLNRTNSPICMLQVALQISSLWSLETESRNALLS